MLLVGDHVVTQIVKTEFVIGAVGDVCAIGSPALFIVESVDDQADRQAQVAIDLAHPFTVALGQVIVDRDDMDAVAGQGIEVDWQRRDQRLAFTGFHLGDPALVEHDAAEDLDGVMFHLQDPFCGLADGGKGLRQDVVETLPGSQAGFEPGCLSLQFGFGQGSHLAVQFFDCLDQRLDPLDFAVGMAAKQFINESHGSGSFHIGVCFESVQDQLVTICAIFQAAVDPADCRRADTGRITDLGVCFLVSQHARDLKSLGQ